MTLAQFLQGEQNAHIEMKGLDYHVFPSVHKDEEGKKLVAVMVRDMENDYKIIFHERFKQNELLSNVLSLELK